MILNNMKTILLDLDLRTIFLMMNYPQLGIGEILMEPTICPGVLTNTFPNIVDLVGPKLLPLP